MYLQSLRAPPGKIDDRSYQGESCGEKRAQQRVVTKTSKSLRFSRIAIRAPRRSPRSSRPRTCEDLKKSRSSPRTRANVSQETLLEHEARGWLCIVYLYNERLKAICNVGREIGNDSLLPHSVVEESDVLCLFTIRRSCLTGFLCLR